MLLEGARTRGDVVEGVCQIAKTGHRLFPALYTYLFASDCSSSHQQVRSPALEYGLGHVTCLVSEMLANVMDTEA